MLARRRINQIRLVRGPNKILLTLADVTFINPSLSNKVSAGLALMLLVTLHKIFLNLYAINLNCLKETQFGRQPMQRHQERVGMQRHVSGLHPLASDLRELQCGHLRSETDLLQNLSLEFWKNMLSHSWVFFCNRVTGRGLKGFLMGHLVALTPKQGICLNWYVQLRPQFNRLDKLFL